MIAPEVLDTSALLARLHEPGVEVLIGVGIWGGLAILTDRWTAVWLAPLLYMVVWEGGQIIATRKRGWRMVWDGALDSVAVALGCIAAAHLRDGNMLIAMWAWAGSFVVACVGWRVRDA